MLHTADNLIRFDFRVSISLGAWFTLGSSRCGGYEASAGASWFCLGRLSPLSDGAIVGGGVDPFKNFANLRMEGSVLYGGERFEGRSVDFVVWEVWFTCKCDTASAPRENLEVESPHPPSQRSSPASSMPVSFPRGTSLPSGAIGTGYGQAEV